MTAMTLIQTVTVPSTPQAAIEFTSIPSTFTDLLVVYSARTNRAALNSDIIIHLNGNTSANYSFRRLFGDGSNPGSDGLTNNSNGGFAGFAVGANATANTFSNCQFYIPNYRSSAAKSWSTDSVTENNGTNAFQTIQASLWNLTDPITSIAIKCFNASSFTQHSSASLYGITAGSSGGVVVS